MITRKGLADEIDAIDASIKDLNASKSDAYQAYREQLVATGMEPRRAGAELAAVKAAIVKRRKLAQDPDAVAEKDELIDTILAEIQMRPSRARETGRDYQDCSLPPSSAPTPSPVQADDSPALSPSAPGSEYTRSATLAGSDGNPSIPSPEADGAKMGDHPDRAAQAVVTSVNSEQAVTHSAMTARTKADVMRLLRPHCQHPDDTDLCGGVGTKHCNACIKAAAEVAA